MTSCGPPRGILASCLWLLATTGVVHAADNVEGNLILLGDNGAWCWYQDERAVHDAVDGTLLIGSVADRMGPGGAARGGDIDVTTFRPADGSRRRFTLHENLQEDDHDAPALLVRPDGRYLAMYARHNNDRFSRYRISVDPHDSSCWGPEQTFDWSATPGANFGACYSNLFYLSAEERTYDFVRANDRAPNMILSGDQGDTWSYGGRLLQPLANVGYVNGYLKYASNGVDEIHFIATEHHPRDYNTSIFHGYIRHGKMCLSDGTEIDDDVFDNEAPNQTDLTRVFAADTVVEGDVISHAWTADLHLDDDGNPYAIFTARANHDPARFNNPSADDRRFFYARFDDARWHVHQLPKAGRRLFRSEQDYTGLVALHPNDPDVLYLSTHIDPADGADLGNHEIFKGVTSDDGATWTWSPITRNSTVDNLRPIIPAWDADHTAVLWFRGTMQTSQNFDTAIVGIIENNHEQAGPTHYVDAAVGTAGNTTLADGSPLAATGPSGDPGPADDNWHRQTGLGNGGSVLAAAGGPAEDAPALKTTLSGLDDGTYDVFVFFWAMPGEEWLVRAGLSADDLLLFRQKTCQQAEPAQFADDVALSGPDGLLLYRAYVGRATVLDGSPASVFVDDYTGTTRRTPTCYDGVGYAKVTALP